MSDATVRRAVAVAAALLVLAVIVASLALVLAAAGYTFAFDYLAYDAAARRLLAGEPVFDLSFDATGTFGLFYYPPTFLFLVLPFALLPVLPAAWAWIVASILVTAVAVAVLPVRRDVRAAPSSGSPGRSCSPSRSVRSGPSCSSASRSDGVGSRGTSHSPGRSRSEPR